MCSNNGRENMCILRWIFGIVIVICVIVGIICMGAGYAPIHDLNVQQKSAQCIYTNHYIEKTRCRMDYVCYESNYVCGNNICIASQCQIWDIECYNGYVFITIEDIVQNVSTFISLNYDESNVINTLNTNYQIGKSVNCYYNINDPKVISFELKDESGLYIAGLVFFMLAVFVCCVWIPFECVLLVQYCIESYRIKQRENRLRAPKCSQCNNVRLENQGTVNKPLYNSDGLCNDCMTAKTNIEEFLGNQDQQFKTNFVQTVIEMTNNS
jgi:hypothetical protein